MRLLPFLCMLAVLFQSCSSGQSSNLSREDPTQTTKVALRFEDDVSLIVLSEILNRYGPGKAPFISIMDKDPNPVLMVELQKEWPNLRPVSESYLHKVGESVKDKTTDKDGIRYQIREIRRLGEDRALVSGGYYTSNLGADGCKYHLKFQDGIWSIAEKTDCWIS